MCAKNAPISQEQRDEQAAAVGCKWTEPCAESGVPKGLRCLTCQHQWKAAPRSIQQEAGCPNCAESGIDPTAASLVYLLTDSRGAAKVGITNTFRRNGKPTKRFKQHARSKWKILDTWDTYTGDQARTVEKAILSWWRNDLNLLPAYQGRDGDTETVDARKIGLDKIRARIEAEIANLDSPD